MLCVFYDNDNINDHDNKLYLQRVFNLVSNTNYMNISKQTGYDQALDCGGITM